jgi:hypothetical protein
MRFLIQLIVIIILASILELFLPWWSITFAAFFGGWLFRTNLNFVAGFLGVALLWTITSLIIDMSAAAPLSERVATTFFLPKPFLFVVTAVIGGLVGGFAAMAGSALRKEKRRMKYY